MADPATSSAGAAPSAENEPPLRLCATRRLARSLSVAAAADGRAAWAATIPDWLDRLFEDALLRGELAGAEMAVRGLSPAQESVLWRRIIGESLGDDQAATLFDLDGLAATAREAHALMETWAIPAAAVQASGQAEALAFLRWRHIFRRHCDRRAWRDAARLTSWRIEKIVEGQCSLPATVVLAGFDRLNPSEQALLSALAGRGVAIDREPPADSPAKCWRIAGFTDAEDEFRAIAAWLKKQLADPARPRVGVVVPDLGAARPALTRLLDQALMPAAAAPVLAGTARPYNVSLGDALARVPLVVTALALLRLAASSRRVELETLGALLASPHWAGGRHEADARARLDARARRNLPATLPLERWLRFAEEYGDGVGHSVRALKSLGKATTASRRLPSAWRQVFRELLDQAGWPGDGGPGGLSSHQFQARQAWLDTLDALAGFDEIVERQSFGEALALLADLCGEAVFQPQTEGRPPIEVLGLLEAAGERFDALWVCGLTAAAWPPPPRPNPLLPLALQQARGLPNGSPDAQWEFASGVHRRFLQAAPELIFSWPRHEGERQLAPSPLVEALADGDDVAEPVDWPRFPSAVETARLAASEVMEWIDDARAPAVADGAAAHLPGGTALFKAQAICPAAAFYQYRLGAAALETPVDGLDPRERGSLLHHVLEAFWPGRGDADLLAMDAAALDRAVEAAVAAGVAAFEARRGDLPARFRALETARLNRLLQAWLAIEKSRGESFSVQACEERHQLSLAGIGATVVIDRVDALADGRRLVIDYKTGARVDAASWAATRISEPQLPIYACFAVDPHPLAGAAFAQIRGDRLGFVGVTESPGLLPGVKALDEARRRFPADRFPDWATLVARWRHALLAIAGEIRAGDARVVFTREADLALSPVLPLLRLAERRRQFEAAGGGVGR